MSSRYRDRDRDPGYRDRDRYHADRDWERDWPREQGRYDSRSEGRGGNRSDPRYDGRHGSRYDARYDSRHPERKEPERPREKDRPRGSHSRERNEKDNRERIDKDRERSDKDRTRHKSKDRPREDSPAGEDSSRKRRRTDDDKQQKQKQHSPQPAKQQQRELTVEEKEAAVKKQREDEQTALDAEMEERRKRVEEWRKKRAAEAAEVAEAERKQQEEAAAAAAAVIDQNKGWSLEDDDDDDHGEQQDEGEEDPLDAFMAGNAAAVAPQTAADNIQQPEQLQQQQTDVDMVDVADAGPAAAVEQQPAEDDDVDPLDAFMAAQVMPEVSRVRWSEPTAPAAAAASQEAAAADDVAAGAIAAANSSRPSSRAGAVSSSRRLSGSKGKSQVRKYYGSSESSEDFSDSEEEPQEEEEQDDATWAKNVTAGKLSKGEKLMAVDHSTIDYPPFRRNFYIEVPEIKRMDENEVAALRKELDGIKVRGKNPPKPIKSWTQVGISSKVLDILRKSGCEHPLPIQAQALPIIMSGRDCIGIAKTGSGKTLAFVIPMLRHIKDQAPLINGDGPVALIMAPTRELVQQISKEVKKLGRAVGLTSVAVFGGTGVANQISELKRGTEVVAATPGRLIDLLVSGGGKITNLRRVTYLVMDEADRMFDMGFEPQIMRIVSNIRPDRQTVMFSATFPRSVETLARQVLQDPVEIQVGGRSVVNSDIAQFVELRPESDRFLRLLEILGEWYEKGKIIIFVHSQDKCDNLFRDLLKSGYPCLSLHGGKEQSDRECTIADFKGAVCNILVATSVAARGLDVRDLVLVVNYDSPNHHEDYVHRVGRTGRAGNKGTAITFIGPDEDRYAPDLVKALKESKAAVPQDLQALADAFAAKRKAGLVQGHGSGYGGSGFKFDKEEDNKVKAARKSKAKEFGLVEEDEEDKEAKSEDDDDIRPTMIGGQQPTAAAPLPAAATANGLPAASMPGVSMTSAPAADPATAAMLAAAAAAGAATVQPAPVPKFLPAQPGQQYPGQAVPQAANSLVEAARLAAERAAAAISGQPMPGAAAAAAAPANASLAAAQAAAMRAAALAAAFAQGGGAPAAAPAAAQQRQPGFESEMEINDFPQTARWKVTHKGFQAEITELTGAAVTTKGLYMARGEPPEGERKLYLLIEAPTEAQVRHAKQAIRKVIEEHVEKAMRKDTGAGGRYNIM